MSVLKVLCEGITDLCPILVIISFPYLIIVWKYVIPCLSVVVIVGK